MRVVISFGVIIALLLIIITTVVSFDLTLLHTNDLHGRIEQVNIDGGTCEPEEAQQGKCYGGVARRYTKMQEIRASNNNVILLDGGNQFQGTLWYNYYKGNATAYFINKLNYDAGGLGNHEFDGGPAVLSRYLKAVNFPLIACNVDASKEPLLNGLFKKSVVLNIGGEKIGITGYLTNKTAIFVPAEFVKNIEFTDIPTCIRREVQKFQNQGINKIITLGHSTFDLEIDIAKQVEGIDIIVGGHTNTFLYNGKPPSNNDAIGPYPYVVTRDNGDKVYIVQDYAYGKYLGFLQVKFDQQGVVTSTTGNPILLDSSIKQDPIILSEIEKWAAPIKSIFDVNIGQSYVRLEGDKSVCRQSECNLGNLLADAMLYEHLLHPGMNNSWSQTSIGIWNSGSIRSSLNQGTITYGKITNVLPYRNEVQSFQILGNYILDMLEHSAMREPSGAFLQVSGIKVTYNLNNPIGNRVIRDKVMIRCSNCTIPRFEPLDENTMYGVVTNTFIMGGGDGFDVLKKYSLNKVRYGSIAVDVLKKYIENHSPITTGLDGRIFFQGGPMPTRPNNAASTFRHHYDLNLLIIFCITIIIVKY